MLKGKLNFVLCTFVLFNKYNEYFFILLANNLEYSINSSLNYINNNTFNTKMLRSENDDQLSGMLMI